MTLRRELRDLFELSKCFARQPVLSFRLLQHLPAMVRGFNHAQRWEESPANDARRPRKDGRGSHPSNPLRDFFDGHSSGCGIWKWLHYFDVYHRHFAKFVGRDVNIVEIGVYSGGSLEMWRHYLGPGCRVFGVDLQPACKRYENEFTEIFIGDQGDPGFWRAFKERVPVVDILVDDGGHRVHQQITTLEEMLAHVQPGGIYLCEDIHGLDDRFASYLSGVIKNLHDMTGRSGEGIRPSAFQSSINSVHVYPFVTVIEKNGACADLLVAPKRGTEWQPVSLQENGRRSD